MGDDPRPLRPPALGTHCLGGHPRSVQRHPHTEGARRSVLRGAPSPPTPNSTASGRNNLKLSYDVFELGGVKGPAGQVANLYITTAITKSVEFASGEQNGVRGYWAEAAEAFKQAAENLSGVAKEVALYKAMLATANTGNAPATLRAADALLAADPKTYYFGPAQETRARVFAQAGRLGDAVGGTQGGHRRARHERPRLLQRRVPEHWLTKFIRASYRGGLHRRGEGVPRSSSRSWIATRRRSSRASRACAS